MLFVCLYKCVHQGFLRLRVMQVLRVLLAAMCLSPLPLGVRVCVRVRPRLSQSVWEDVSP